VGGASVVAIVTPVTPRDLAQRRRIRFTMLTVLRFRSEAQPVSAPAAATVAWNAR
jgi:hypothetical protein